MNKPVVLLTGALTGIGRAAALAFAKKGANVVVAGRRDEAGKAFEYHDFCTKGGSATLGRDVRLLRVSRRAGRHARRVSS